MLAKLSDGPFDRPNWVFEIKYDGYRALALCDGKGNVDFYSRNFQSFNETYAPVVEELKKIKFPCLLDGEVVVEDAKGRSRFQLLQGVRETGKQLKYYVFDLLNLEGNDTTGLTLLERKELLKLLLQKQKLKNIIYSDHIEEKGNAFYKAAVKKGLEGIMGKNADSVYEVGKRTSEWLKIKITNEQEAIIIGITAPKGSRNHFGALLLGAYDGKDLIYTGKCGTGFDEAALKDLYTKFKPYFTKTQPVKQVVREKGITWLKPHFVCQVKFTEWTTDNSMRHPVYLGLRKDKKPGEVKIEKVK